MPPSKTSGLRPHGERKYNSSELLLSSIGRGWPNIAAELRSHGAGIVPAVAPQQMEITIAVDGNADGVVSRSGAGQRQATRATDGAIWLSPVGVGDNEIDISGNLPRILHLYLSPERLLALCDDYNLPKMPAHSIRYAAGVEDEVIKHLGLGLLAELSAETWAGTMFAEMSCLALASRLIQSYSDVGEWRPFENSTKPDADRIRRVVEYIADNIERDISIKELAGVACLSVFHFCRMFKATLGMPPHRFVSLQRLEKAKRMLSDGHLSLSEVALLARFSNQASFTRAFRRAVGMTPGEFRRQPA
ncbi:AraC family transcriptional regulator (plasmid) [Rhizobium sp. CC1099]|uniref:helix-turn-helix domain-containing protein n=1 Tax=Rhizobium sp. CC1099 TaxID=3039160 RepID=UPI0024B1C1B2|nr:AraC family transcriptional regulator [Rhizobium sp. CC1099]WFU91404.1 AraC family transcriptional regulator [Rhizobium sp. CC1099]